MRDLGRNISSFFTPASSLETPSFTLAVLGISLEQGHKDSDKFETRKGTFTLLCDAKESSVS